jgi:hypothetical protein
MFATNAFSPTNKIYPTGKSPSSRDRVKEEADVFDSDNENDKPNSDEDNIGELKVLPKQSEDIDEANER